MSAEGEQAYISVQAFLGNIADENRGTECWRCTWERARIEGGTIHVA